MAELDELRKESDEGNNELEEALKNRIDLNSTHNTNA